MLRTVSFLILGGIAATASAQTLTDLEATGRYAELERVAEQKLAQQAQPGASVLGPLCLAYSRVKRYAKLFDCLERLERRIAAGDTVMVADKSMVSDSDALPFPGMLRAEALVELGDTGRAAKEADAALARVRDVLPYGIWPAKMYRLALLGTSGVAYALAGDRKQALERAKTLEDFSVGFMGSAIIGPFKANALARVHMALGDYAKAFEFIQGEEGAWIRSVWFLNNAAWGYSGDDVAQGRVVLPKLLMRGKCLSELGRLDEAKAALDAILRNARVADRGELYWLALFERGRIAEKQGAAEQAIEYYRRAIEVIEQQRSSIHTEANKIGFVGDKQAVYASLIALLIERGAAADAFDAVERSKSRALVDLLAAKKDFSVQGADPERAKRIVAELDAADAAARVQSDAAAPAQGGGLRGLEAARREIREAAPELATLVTVSSVPARELHGLIAEGEALVEYYVQGNDLFAFVLDRERLQGRRLDGAGLTAELRALRSALELPGSTAWRAPARSLHERLWRPLEPMISAKRIVVVAHGALHYLPFGALLEPDGSFLIDRHALRFLPSASVLAFLRPALKSAQLLALGNPDLGDPKLDLAFAEGEARALGAMFPDSRVLLRAAASETNFRKAAGAFSRIHLATHGSFDAGDPLHSGLRLAPDADNDGMLSVAELYSMRLDADLVTLSACETGLGRIASGDDVVGLTRGFLYAGSRAIVASLWSVDDRATAELMRAFYANLAGMKKDEALRQAQIAARAGFPHPFYWAAFQLTGRSD